MKLFFLFLTVFVFSSFFVLYQRNEICSEKFDKEFDVYAGVRPLVKQNQKSKKKII